MTSGAALLQEYLRQRRELGESEVVLDRLSAAEALRLLRQTGSATVDHPSVDPRQVSPGPRRTHNDSPLQRDSAAAGARVEAAIGSATDSESVALPDHRSPRSSSALAAPEVVQLGEMASLRTSALACTRCGVSTSRRQVVFGEGNENAELMVVGEAPGAEEDRSGRPFVGRAGKLLDRLLASIGFPRESVYICNVLKCRPPANRNPTPEEIEACSPYLRRQLELVAPRAILTVGTFPSQTLLASGDPISRLRGRVHEYHGIPLVPTYHPAALLRNPGWIRPAWDDLQRLRSLLDQDPARA